MATEVCKGYSDLLQELNKARDNLKGLNDNIRKIIGRDPSSTEQYNSGNSFGAYSRNETKKRSSSGFDINRRTDQERRYSDINQNGSKRRAMGETKSVFSRLSGPPNRDAEYEKPRVYSRVIKEQPTRQEVVAAQGSDEQSRARNRRMFSSLLGTLQKFSQEESKLKSKEEKKAQIEKKLEEQQKVERENLRKEKQCLFTDRKRQQLEIRAIETKMIKMRDFETWEQHKKPLSNFIKTQTKPHIYFLPKKLDAKMEKKLTDCQEEHRKTIEQKRQEVMKSISNVEERFQEDIKRLEEYATRRSDATLNNSKLDRCLTGEEEDDFQDDDHANSLYNDDDHYENVEGPALPSTMVASNFKITIQNHEIKQEKTEPLHTTVRLIDESDSTKALPDKSSYITQNDNFQITFKTDSDC
ncbi:pinin [Sabethes cyaneus]|uniref:pinin n=1 Tax=Sabethes cyaneus TaxID=53552 RepID=UPI00221E3638|nr:pinin [Sabethes cyaneus]XP_053693198.1 pinin [Sabethes cyaneus]